MALWITSLTFAVLRLLALALFIIISLTRIEMQDVVVVVYLFELRMGFDFKTYCKHK